MTCSTKLSTPHMESFKYLSPWNPADTSILLPPIVVVSCFLRQENKILVLQRARKDQQHKLWGIPGGKLDKGESPLEGLVRELQEETTIVAQPDSFQLLGTAISRTPSDGQYGLYIYYGFAPQDIDIQINTDEHYAFQWVTIEEFQALDLLTAQREAFHLVKTKLEHLLNSPPTT